jgi:ferredoxin
MCDGLGACIGHCPQGAISIESREAEPYNETKVIDEMKEKGKNTVVAHLKHLKDHGETELLREGVSYLKLNSDKLSFNLEEVIAEVHNHGQKSNLMVNNNMHQHHSGGCPGSKERIIERPGLATETISEQPSELRQWPIQMHLINPAASYFRGADLLLAADCVAYAAGGFHGKYLKGKSLAIACPKLDHGTEIYIEKLTGLIDNARVNTITVMLMEVPCCGGLLQMLKLSQSKASRKVPVK